MFQCLLLCLFASTFLSGWFNRINEFSLLTRCTYFTLYSQFTCHILQFCFPSLSFRLFRDWILFDICQTLRFVYIRCGSAIVTFACLRRVFYSRYFFNGSLTGRMEFKIPTAFNTFNFSFLAILSLLYSLLLLFSFSDWNVGAVVAISEASPVKGLAGTRLSGRIQPEA